MNNFNNMITVTKIRLSSHKFVISTIKWYNLQEDMKICKNCERKEIGNEIHMIFSCDKMTTVEGKHFMT